MRWSGTVSALHLAYIVMGATVLIVITMLRTKLRDEMQLKQLWSVIQMHSGQKLLAAHMVHEIVGYVVKPDFFLSF